MEINRRLDIKAEELIYNKKKEIFFVTLKKILRLLSLKDEDNSLVTEVRQGESLTRTFGENCLQIGKKGDLCCLLSSGWKVIVEDKEDGFYIELISPSSSQISLTFKSSLTPSANIFSLDIQKLIFIPLSRHTMFFSIFYSYGFKIIPLLSILVENQSVKRFIIEKFPFIIDEELEGFFEIRKELVRPPIVLEIGKDLLCLMRPETKRQFLERIASVRKHILQDMGVLVPKVKVKDNLGLKKREFLLTIKDRQVASGEVYMRRLLAIGPVDYLKKLRGKEVLDPTYNMSGVWIRPREREIAEKFGCMIFDPISVIATLLTEIFRKNAFKFLGLQDTEELLNVILKDYPVVFRELNKVISLMNLNKILHNLLAEEISICDLLSICETVIEYSQVTKDTGRLTEYVRASLGSTICELYSTYDGKIYVASLEDELEKFLIHNLKRSEQGRCIVLDDKTMRRVLLNFQTCYELFQSKGLKPVLLSSPLIRPYLKKLLLKEFPSMAVLSFNEIVPEVKVKVFSTVSFQENNRDF